MPTVNSGIKQKLVADMSKCLEGGTVALLDWDGNDLISLDLSVRVSADGMSLSASPLEPLILGGMDKIAAKIVWRSSKNSDVAWEETAMACDYSPLAKTLFSPSLSLGNIEPDLEPDLEAQHRAEGDAYAAEHQEEWDREDAEWYQEHYGGD